MSSQHLPECYYGEPVRGGHITDCICERLRAAEQRVNAEWAQTRTRNQRVQELIAEARADALGKAREAVAGMTSLPNAWIKHQQALARIDAIRDRQIVAELTRDGQEQA